MIIHSFSTYDEKKECIELVIQHIQVDPGKPGAEVSKKGKNYTPKKENVPIECAYGDQPMRCPNRDFCVHQPSAVRLVVGVFKWCVGGGDVMSSDAKWCRYIGMPETSWRRSPSHPLKGFPTTRPRHSPMTNLYFHAKPWEASMWFPFWWCFAGLPMDSTAMTLKMWSHHDENMAYSPENLHRYPK